MNLFSLKNHVCFSSQLKIEEISFPFLKATGLSFFSYARRMNQTASFSFQNDNRVYEAWFHHCKSCTCDHQEGVYAWFDLRNEAFMRAVNDLNYANGVYILKNHDDYTEVFGLNAPIGTFNVMQYYVNNIEFINRFFAYFKDKAAGLIEKASLAPIAGPRNLLLTGKTQVETQMFKPRCEFNVSKFYFNEQYKGIKLSVREQQCLSLYLKGHTALEIAEILRLKKPTIDTFLRSIKQKFHCKKASELFEAFWQLGILKSNGTFGF